MEAPLQGVKVLDLTRFLAGPFCTMVLADMGADVIKVEPLEGDSTRSMPPYFIDGDSAYFWSINRNKRSIAIDLHTPKGREILLRLIRGHDVIVDNLRPSQRQHLGVAYSDLQHENSLIVSCSITGFGSNGPYQERPAYAIIVEALSGVMSLTGEKNGLPVKSGVPIGDLAAAQYAVTGILSGLLARERTKQGVHIDVSMLDAQVSLLTYLGSYYFASGDVPERQGRGHPSIPTYDTFSASDDQLLVIAVHEPKMWRELCSVLDLFDLPEDERFATPAARLRHREELRELLAQGFKRRPAAEWEHKLLRVGVPVARVRAVDDLEHDPQLRARDMIVELEGRGKGMRTFGNPVVVDGLRPHYIAPPRLGEHTQQVLEEVGLSAADIEQLEAAKVIVLHNGQGGNAHESGPRDQLASGAD